MLWRTERTESHAIEPGALISERLKGLGKRLTVVWIGTEQMATVEGIREGVRLSQHFILILD